MRKKPYTARGIRRVPCLRCGRPSVTQWSICADGNQQRGTCMDCDLELNRLVLEWAGFPDVEERMARYRETLAASLGPSGGR